MITDSRILLALITLVLFAGLFIIFYIEYLIKNRRKEKNSVSISPRLKPIYYPGSPKPKKNGESTKIYKKIRHIQKIQEQDKRRKVK